LLSDFPRTDDDFRPIEEIGRYMDKRKTNLSHILATGLFWRAGPMFCNQAKTLTPLSDLAGSEHVFCDDADFFGKFLFPTSSTSQVSN